MKHLVVLAALLAAIPCARAGEFTIKNGSMWAIHYIHVSSSDDEEWGPDQLEDDILDTGKSLTLRGVDCDYYDVRLVDEDDDVCVVNKVRLCGETAWTITNESLLSCQAE